MAKATLPGPVPRASRGSARSAVTFLCAPHVCQDSAPLSPEHILPARARAADKGMFVAGACAGESGVGKGAKEIQRA